MSKPTAPAEIPRETPVITLALHGNASGAPGSSQNGMVAMLEEEGRERFQ